MINYSNSILLLIALLLDFKKIKNNDDNIPKEYTYFYNHFNHYCKNFYDNISKIGEFITCGDVNQSEDVSNKNNEKPKNNIKNINNEFVKKIPEFNERLKVTPGLSGLAQIRGSYDLDPSEKIKYDIEYIKKMSLLFDIRIIILSVFNSILARWDSPDN